jgi:hypothetical protein
MPTEPDPRAAALEAEFRADLDTLLRKYRGYLEAKDCWQGHPECGADIRIEATIKRMVPHADGYTEELMAFVDFGSCVEPAPTA